MNLQTKLPALNLDNIPNFDVLLLIKYLFLLFLILKIIQIVLFFYRFSIQNEAQISQLYPQTQSNTHKCQNQMTLKVSLENDCQPTCAVIKCNEGTQTSAQKVANSYKQEQGKISNYTHCQQFSDPDSQNSKQNFPKDNDQDDIDISIDSALSNQNKIDDQFQKEETQNTDDRTVCTNQETNDMIEEFNDYKIKIQEPTSDNIKIGIMNQNSHLCIQFSIGIGEKGPKVLTINSTQQQVHKQTQQMVRPFTF